MHPWARRARQLCGARCDWFGDSERRAHLLKPTPCRSCCRPRRSATGRLSARPSTVGHNRNVVDTYAARVDLTHLRGSHEGACASAGLGRRRRHGCARRAEEPLPQRYHAPADNTLRARLGLFGSLGRFGCALFLLVLAARDHIAKLILRTHPGAHEARHTSAVRASLRCMPCESPTYDEDILAVAIHKRVILFQTAHATVPERRERADGRRCASPGLLHGRLAEPRRECAHSRLCRNVDMSVARG